MLSIVQTHQLTGHTAAVFALSAAEEPSCFYSADGNGWVVKWDLREKDLGTAVAQAPSNVFSLKLLPNPRLLAVGTMQGTLYFIDYHQKTLLDSSIQTGKPVFCVETNQSVMYFGSGTGQLFETDIATLAISRQLQICLSSIRSIHIHPVLPVLALGCSDNLVYLVNLETFEISEVLSFHQSSVFSVRFSPDGRYLLCGSRDAYLSVWEMNPGKSSVLLHTIPAHLFTINSLTYLPPFSLFASASRDKTIKLWDAETFELLKVIDPLKSDNWNTHKNSVNCLLWLPDVQALVSGGDDRTLLVWQIST